MGVGDKDAAKYDWAGNVQKGDCSILIKKANATEDEGDWECQVTYSNRDDRDSLSSPPVRLVVRGKRYFIKVATSSSIHWPTKI